MFGLDSPSRALVALAELPFSSIWTASVLGNLKHPSEIGDMVCEILIVSLKGRRNLEREAENIGRTFEGFVAAAITQRVSEKVEGQSRPKKAKSESNSAKLAENEEIDQLQ